MAQRLFVWDYHGVLERGNELALMKISNHALAQEGYAPRLTLDDVRQLYGERWHVFFAHALPGEPPATHQKLVDTALRYDLAHPEIRKKHIKSTLYGHGVLTAIGHVHQQVLISNCHDITVFLTLTAMDRYFPEGQRFSTGATRPAKTKQRLLDEYLAATAKSKPGLRYERVVFIGDRPEDLTLQQTMTPDERRILYTHPGLEPKPSAADRTIHDLRELLDEL